MEGGAEEGAEVVPEGAAVGVTEAGLITGEEVGPPNSPLYVPSRWHRRSIPQVPSSLQHWALSVHPHRVPG